MRLNVKAFALTTAILSGAGSFLLTLLSVLTGFAKAFFSIQVTAIQSWGRLSALSG